MLAILILPPLVEAAPVENLNNEVQTVTPLGNTTDQQVEEPVSEPTERQEEEVLTPPPAPVTAPSSCASEIKKYDWNQTVAYEVMMVESGNNHSIVNDNPSTGDYSVGCFQINLYGNLKNTRPSEAWLKVPANNVEYAYQMWSSQGWTPWGHTTCRYKVKCY